MKQTSSGDVIRFSTTSTTPSFVFKPKAVEPSCKKLRKKIGKFDKMDKNKKNHVKEDGRRRR